MMDGKVSDIDTDSTINLMICESEGMRIGIDMDQVSEICEKVSAERKDLSVIHLHEKMSRFPVGTGYKTPRVLVVKNHRVPAGIVVDMPREIVSMPVTSIRPLPRLIGMLKKSTPVWGVALWQNSIVLLVDLLSLFDNEET